MGALDKVTLFSRACLVIPKLECDASATSPIFGNVMPQAAEKRYFAAPSNLLQTVQAAAFRIYRKK